MYRRNIWATGLSNPGTNYFEIKHSVFIAGVKVLYQQESVPAMFQINAGRGAEHCAHRLPHHLFC